MRLTVLGQYAKGLKHHDAEQADEAERQLERIKWYLWNGNVRDALFWAERLADEIWSLDSDYPSMKRFARTAAEFCTYVANNAGAIPNYAVAPALRRAGRHVVRRVHGQPRGRQALRQTATDAMVVERRAPAAADPDAGARRHAASDVRTVGSRPCRQRRGWLGTSRGSLNLPGFVVLPR